MDFDVDGRNNTGFCDYINVRTLRLRSSILLSANVDSCWKITYSLLQSTIMIYFVFSVILSREYYLEYYLEKWIR